MAGAFRDLRGTAQLSMLHYFVVLHELQVAPLNLKDIGAALVMLLKLLLNTAAV
jgi:hypothetical protein